MALGRTNAGSDGVNVRSAIVTAPVGTTVTVENRALNKTMSRVTGASGISTFRGLDDGVWYFSMTDGSQSSTPIPYDIDAAPYNITLAFFSASITVNYPLGAICTASGNINGTVQTFYAPDVSGQWIFNAPAATTWTIRIESADGSKSKENTVSISSNGQTETITMVFELVLYDAGNEYSSITGGWFAYGNRYASTNEAAFLPKKPNYIEFKTNGGNYVAKTNNVVDFTGYTTLHIHVATLTTVPLEETALALKITSGSGTNDGTVKVKKAIYASTTNQATVTNQTYDMPLNSVTSGYVGASVDNSSYGTIQFTKIWAT